MTALSRLPVEARSGLLLAGAALAAMLAANIPGLDRLYALLLDVPVIVQVGTLGIAKPLLLWINDGLMALFFLFVGLELKREAVEGALRDPRVAALPVAGAVGGVILPTAIFFAVAWGEPGIQRGWAIPAATDIAFAMGVAALLGRHFPPALRIFLLTLAIVDDLVAIVIIAIFYTVELSGVALTVAGLALATLLVLNRLGCMRVAAYVVVGVVLWVSVLKSGVHATLGGVALGLAIPLTDRRGREGPAHAFEHALAPWVNFVILPVFAFANAGVALAGMSLATLAEPLPAAIALGLFVGKQAGVTAAVALAVASGAARLPQGTSWAQLHGAAMLTGIGFTMSLFIGGLAFPGDAMLDQMRIGVLVGSLASILAATAWLRSCRPAGA